VREKELNKAGQRITAFLTTQGVDFIHFVNISAFSENQNKGFPCAILFGIALSPAYLIKVYQSPGYVKRMIHNKQIETDEFHLTELRTDAIADSLASYIKQLGYSAFSQSEKNLERSGTYNLKKQTTPLPHKTVALSAGLGWIGKHNLLVTPEYGCAVSMCTVLTDVPLKTISEPIKKSQCGECSICLTACAPKSLSGKLWSKGTERDEILNIGTCTTCLQCMVSCPWTQKYASNMIEP